MFVAITSTQKSQNTYNQNSHIRRLANRRTKQKQLAWLKRVATAVTDNHVDRAPQINYRQISVGKPSAKTTDIKINICRI